MIGPTLARLIVREHLYKPLDGKVLCLGRQSIVMNYEQVLELFAQESYSPSEDVQRKLKLTLDEETRGGGDLDRISDKAFFDLFGVRELVSMDVSAYEGADIIHNLNLPVPEHLNGQFDFIIDGGTFDHLFDVRVAFENLVKLLRPGGRVLQWNAASNFTGSAYLSFGPDFCYDYYVSNQFADCQVYVVEVRNPGQDELWDFYLFEGTGDYVAFRSPHVQMTVVMAEKGLHSTWDRMPVQAKYRDETLWEPYRQGQKLISTSTRKPLTGSKKGLTLSTRWVHKMARPPLITQVKMIPAKVREKGILWCAARAATKSYRLVRPLRRAANAEKLVGYKYLGKI